MKDFSSINEKILQLRDSGEVHCNFTTRHDQDIQKSLRKFCEQMGFSVTKDLKKVDREMALKILRLILMKDLVYKSPLMTEEQASELASDFCNLFGNSAKFFTNGSFEESLSNNLSLKSWNPITKAAFDTGILIIDEKSTGCLWVEDED